MTIPYPPVAQQSCCNCRYWREDRSLQREDNRRCCCRYAPKPLLSVSFSDEADIEAYWPLVYGDEWCGDWVPQEVAL